MMANLHKFKESAPLSAIGLMSGTSMDGIDAAWIETDGEAVTTMGAALTLPYAPQFRARLHDFVATVPEKSHADAASIEAALTDLHAEAVRELMAKVGHAPDVIGFHGQTIWHRPQVCQTWQMGDGQRLAKALNIPVVFDFRSNDVANGGQGAPLLPLFHAKLLAAQEKPVVVANIGGVANITWLGALRPQATSTQFPFEILGFDTGPGNALIDDWMLKCVGVALDQNGNAARAGRVDQPRLEKLLDAEFFSAKPPKSLDRQAFSASIANGLSVNDGAATLAEFTAASLAQGIALCPSPPARILVTGGGRHNPVVMERLGALSGLPVEPIEAVGCNGDVLEAQAFGYFAVRMIRGLPLTYPELTGAPAPQVGGRLVQV